MADDNRNKWYRLPKVKLDKRYIVRRMRRVEGATFKHAHKFIVKRWGNIRDVQFHIIAWVMAMGILIAATGLQLMWYQQSYRTVAPSNDGIYAEATIGPINALNPLFAATSAERSASRLIFSSILQYDTTGHLNNDLAADIEVDSTSMVYTVKIRPDVKWHDDVSLTAKDVAFTVGLMKNPNVHTAIIGWKDVTVKVIDDFTISFSLPSVYAAFEDALTFPIVPEHILGDVAPGSIRENSFSQNPIGSGPFKFRFIAKSASTSLDNEVVYLARNDNYYSREPQLASFQLHVCSKSEEIAKALEINEVNAAADLSQTDIANIDLNRYKVLSKSIQSGVYALLNTNSLVLGDVNVRSALRMATNSKAIRDKLPVTTNDIYLPFTNGQLTGDVPPVPQYNLDQAKNKLDSIGWIVNKDGIREKDGKELQLSVMAMKDSEFERVLESISGQWRSLGAVVNTNILDPSDISRAVAKNILQPRNFDVLLYQLNIGSDLDVYAYWHSSQANSQGSNYSNYSNIISDDALVTARSRTEPALRNAKYITFAKQWLADVPAIGLYQSTTQYVTGLNVNSLRQSDAFVSSIDRYSSVYDWSVGSRNVYKTP
jgi:peptide/nickel transport system substrate-binding protein